MNELTPLEDDIDLTDPAEGAEGGADDAQPENEPNEMEALRAELDELKRSKAEVDELKRSVGRIQSLMAKYDSATSDTQRAELQKQMNERFSSLEGQLGEVVSGMDESALDPATRQRILQVQERARQEASVRQAVEQEIAKRAPRPQAQPQVSPLETELVNTIMAAGLDPDDSAVFDWAEMSKIAQGDGTGRAVRQHVLTKILEAKAEDAAAARRSSAKKQAGNGTPRADSGTLNPAGRMKAAMDKGDFASAYAELRKLTANA